MLDNDVIEYIKFQNASFNSSGDMSGQIIAIFEYRSSSSSSSTTSSSSSRPFFVHAPQTKPKEIQGLFMARSIRYSQGCVIDHFKKFRDAKYGRGGHALFSTANSYSKI